MWLSELRARFSDGRARLIRCLDGFPDNREQSGKARFRWWWFALLVVAVFLLLAFREPGAIRKPSFVAEDGFTFFKQSYEEPFWRIVLRPHAGYIQLVQRLIAELASFAPLEYLPLVYALAALLVAAMSMTFFALPSFRSVVRSDPLRAVVILALPFMPNADSLARVAAVHWYHVFFLALVSIMTIPRGRFAAGLLWLAAALAFWSQPVAIVCVPVLVCRIWLAEPGPERRWWLALTVVATVYPFTTESRMALATLWHTPGVLLSLRHAVGYRVFCFFVLGDDISRLVLTQGWYMTTRLSLFCLGLCAAAAWWPRAARSPRTGFTLALLSYYVLLLPVPYILCAEIIPDFLTINENTSIAHQRYFYVSVLLLCVLGAAAYQEAGSAWRRHAAAGLPLLGWLGLHTTTYRLWDFQSHPGWPHFARHIRQAEARARQTGVGERIAIETTPYIFVLDMGFPSPSAQPQW